MTIGKMGAVAPESVRGLCPSQHLIASGLIELHYIVGP